MPPANCATGSSVLQAPGFRPSSAPEYVRVTHPRAYGIHAAVVKEPAKHSASVGALVTQDNWLQGPQPALEDLSSQIYWGIETAQALEGMPKQTQRYISESNSQTRREELAPMTILNQQAAAKANLETTLPAHAPENRAPTINPGRGWKCLFLCICLLVVVYGAVGIHSATVCERKR